MKYQILLIITIALTLLSGCSQQKEEKPIINNRGTMIVTDISDQKKITDNLKEQGYTDGCYTNPIKNCFSIYSGVMFFEKAGNSGYIVISNAINNTGNIHENIYIESGFLIYNDQWKIKTPKHTLGLGGLYDINNKLLNSISIYPPEYRMPIGADEIKISINPIISGNICNPYDLNYYDMKYYETLKKNGEFSVSEKTINGINTVITYQKFCYSDVSMKCNNPLKRIGNYCIAINNKEYNIHVMLKSKKEVISILNSFTLLK